MKISTVLTDDLDGSTEGVTAHQFSLDGVAYEIDLSTANLDRLRAAVAPFIAAARRLPKPVTTSQRESMGERRSGRGHGAAIRAWWAANQGRDGLPAYHDGGAIPRQVRQAYTAVPPQSRATGEH